MISGILFIILAWAAALPVWVSVVLTIWGVFCIEAFIVRVVIYYFVLK